MSTRFPVTDHCDGRHFFNPDGVQARSFMDLPKWWWQRMILGQGERWPKSVPASQVPRLPAEIAEGDVAATFIGHATFLLQFTGLNLLTDPVFSERASPLSWAGPKRVRPPALSLTQLPRIDIVLVSHNHYDHLDLPTLRWLAQKHRPLVVTSLRNKTWLEKRGVPNVVELDWWQSHRVSVDFEVTGTPAHHFAARWPWDRCETLWGGFMIRTAHGSIFFCGDSGWAGHFAEIRQRLGAPDLALLPIGAYDPRWFLEPVHLNPDEAVRAHRALGARQSIAMHYGTFQLTNEGIDAPLHALAAARIAHGVGEKDFIALEFGVTAYGRLRTV